MAMYKHTISLNGITVGVGVTDILTPTNLPPVVLPNTPVELNASMEWKERYQSYHVAQSVNRTVGGRAIVFATPLRAGRKVTLEATQDHGWVTRATADLLMQMASSVGATFALKIGKVEVDANGDEVVGGDHKVETLSVIFRHNEPPALELSPLIHRSYHEETDLFIGSVKLITI